MGNSNRPVRRGHGANGNGPLWGGVALVTAGLLLLIAGAAPAVAPARLVVEGVSPAGDQAPAGRSPRQAALRQGIGEAVRQVGEDLVAADRGAVPQDLDVLAALGGAPADYAVRYRVLTEHGERAARVLRDPAVSVEYAVEIEVQVDVDRVARGLRSAGWIRTVPGQIPSHAHRVIVETTDWAAYAAFVDQLRRRGEARLAVPERFEAGRVVLRVEAPGRPGQLLDRLAGDPEGRLELIPLSQGPGELRVRVRLLAPAAASGAGGPVRAPSD